MVRAIACANRLDNIAISEPEQIQQSLNDNPESEPNAAKLLYILTKSTYFRRMRNVKFSDIDEDGKGSRQALI